MGSVQLSYPWSVLFGCCVIMKVTNVTSTISYRFIIYDCGTSGKTDIADATRSSESTLNPKHIKVRTNREWQIPGNLALTRRPCLPISPFNDQGAPRFKAYVSPPAPSTILRMVMPGDLQGLLKPNRVLKLSKLCSWRHSYHLSS